MGKLPEWNKLSKWAQEEIENLNSPISIKGIKFPVKNFPTKKLQAQMALLADYNKHLKKV